MQKTVKNLLKVANIEGYFMNHSCRRSSTTKLFQAGVDKKLIKEITGHHSDAVDTYSVTSDKQREEMSKIMSDAPVSKKVETVVKSSDDTKIECNNKTIVKSCTCGASGNVNVGLDS